MRTPIIAGNWKMYKNIDEAKSLAIDLKNLVSEVRDRQVFICPSFVCLAAVRDIVKGTRIALGAQNVNYEEEGAYTGEVSADMLKSIGVSFVILGHSERRAYFHETDESINKKLKKVLSKSMTPIVCVGELLEDRERGSTADVIKKQIHGCFENISPEDLIKIVIAYEPVWAIGTGKTASPEQAEEVHALIRSELKSKYSDAVSEQVRIQYGGSVKPENIDELMKKPNIDGALVGGASLKAEDFARIVKFER